MSFNSSARGALHVVRLRFEKIVALRNLFVFHNSCHVDGAERFDAVFEFGQPPLRRGHIFNRDVHFLGFAAGELVFFPQLFEDSIVFTALVFTAFAQASKFKANRLATRGSFAFLFGATRSSVARVPCALRRWR